MANATLDALLLAEADLMAAEEAELFVVPFFAARCQARMQHFASTLLKSSTKGGCHLIVYGRTTY